jgi:hypothetical protein
MIKGLFKLTLFVINIFYFVAGGVLFGVGIWLAADHPDFKIVIDDLDEDAYGAVVGIMITIGLILFLVGFFGCCGIRKKNECMITTYAICMMCLIGIQIALLVVSGSFLDSVNKGDMTRTMQNQIRTKYGQLDEYTEFWDDFQETIECCGAVDYRDWRGSNYTITTTNEVPQSCCKTGADYDNCKSEAENYYGPDCSGNTPRNGTWDYLNPCGCFTTIDDEIQSASAGIIAGTTIMIGVEVVAIIIACMVKKNIDDD